MTRRGDLPPELGSTFSVRAACDAGVPKGRLRASDLERPFHGARSLLDAVDAAALTLEAAHLRDVLAYAQVMGDGEFIAGLSAAVVWGVPLARHVLSRMDAVQVGVHWPARAPRSRGVKGHAIQPHLAMTQVHPDFELRVVSPATMWASLATTVHPYDLIAVGDAVVREPRLATHLPPLTTMTRLEAAVAAGRRAGSRQLRQALPRIRTHAESRTETWTRLTLVDGRLPEPELAWTVRDAGGRKLACVDMAYPQWRIVIEYEGEHHLTDPDQWDRDIARYMRLEQAGWRVIRVTKAMLFTRPDQLVSVVREAIATRS